MHPKSQSFGVRFLFARRRCFGCRGKRKASTRGRLRALRGGEGGNNPSSERRKAKNNLLLYKYCRFAAIFKDSPVKGIIYRILLEYCRFAAIFKDPL